MIDSSSPFYLNVAAYQHDNPRLTEAVGQGIYPTTFWWSIQERKVPKCVYMCCMIRMMACNYHNTFPTSFDYDSVMPSSPTNIHVSLMFDMAIPTCFNICVYTLCNKFSSVENNSSTKGVCDVVLKAMLEI